MFFLQRTGEKISPLLVHAPLPTKNFPAKPGDILTHQTETLLQLGPQLQLPAAQNSRTISSPDFFSDRTPHKFLAPKTLARLHELVGHNFTSYPATAKLFFPETPQKILARAQSTLRARAPRLPSSRPSVSAKLLAAAKNSQNFSENSEISLPTREQILVVFPDFRSLLQRLPADPTERRPRIRHHALTPLQKSKIFAGVSSGDTRVLFTTPHGIFQNRKKLAQIFCFLPRRRSYAHQRDPRIKTPTALEQLAIQHDAQLFLPDFS